MNALPSIIVIDFCEWLKERVKRGDNQREEDILELVLYHDSRLKEYANEYLYEDGFIFRKILHKFIDSEEFKHCMRHYCSFLYKEKFHFRHREDLRL